MTIKYVIPGFFLLLTLNLLVFSQTPPDTLWSKIYGGFGFNDAISIIQTFDSCYVILGHTRSDGNMDIGLFKTDKSGNIIWDNSFGGSSSDFGVIVKQTLDNGFIIVGTTESYGDGDRNIWLIKTDEYGDEQWSKVYDDTYDNTCKAQYVSITSDGGYIITGGTGDFTANNMDAWLIKTDEQGNEEWNMKIGGSGNQKAYRIFQINEGGYILSGNTQSSGNGDIWLVKTNENGNILWEKTFGGSEFDNAYSMQITTDNGYILAGYTKSFGNGEEDLWLIKTDSLGNEIWNTVYGEQQVNVVYSVQQTIDGGYIAGGLTNCHGNGGFDFWVVKADAGGNIMWEKTIGGTQDEFVFSIVQTYDKGYIAAGRTHSFGNDEGDAYVVKLNSESSGFYNNYLEKESSLWVYPNPFYQSTTITYNLNNAEFVTIKIYNLMGNEINTLTNEEKTPGKHSIEFDGSNLSSGIYFYRLQTDDYSETKKMFLIRK